MNSPRSRLLATALLALPAACPLAQTAQDPVAAAAAPAVLADARSPAERQAIVYEEFQREFSAGRFEAALLKARELVALIETGDPLSDELPTAYNNLGAVRAVRALAEELAHFAGASSGEIRCLSVAGNTTMAHFLLGLDPGNLCRAPSVPAANRFPVARAAELGLGVDPLAPGSREPGSAGGLAGLGAGESDVAVRAAAQPSFPSSLVVGAVTGMQRDG